MRMLLFAAALAVVPIAANACAPSPICWIEEGPQYLRFICKQDASGKPVTVLDEPEKLQDYVRACAKLGIKLPQRRQSDDAIAGHRREPLALAPSVHALLLLHTLLHKPQKTLVLWTFRG